MIVLDVLIRNLKQLTRTPSSLGMVFAFPFIFVAVFSLIFSGGGVSMQNTYSIGVVNQDIIDPSWTTIFEDQLGPNAQVLFDKGFGSFLLQSLENQTDLSILTDFSYEVKMYSSVEELTDKVRDRTVTLGIVIPANFSRAILAGINHQQTLQGNSLTNASEFASATATVEVVGDTSYQRFQNTQREFGKSLEQYYNLFTGVGYSGGEYHAVVESVTSYQLEQFDFFIPGFSVFVLVLGASNLAYVVGRERALGTLDRLRISSVEPATYLLGLSLAQYLILGTQVTVMLAGSYLFGFNGRGNPLEALVVAFMSIPAIMGLALLVAGLDKTGENANGIMAILSAPVGFLSGAFIPLPDATLVEGFVPDGHGGTRALSLWDFNPFQCAVRAESLILLNQYSLLEVWVELVFLVVGGAIIFLLGAGVFVTRVFQDDS